MKPILIAIAVALLVAMLMLAWLDPSRLQHSPTIAWIAAGNWMGLLASVLAIFVVAMPLLFSVINQLANEKTEDLAEAARREVSRNGLVLGVAFVALILVSSFVEVVFRSSGTPWTTALQTSVVVVFGLVLIDTIQTIIGLRTVFRGQNQ